ncbi:MAG: four helix bundle protein [Gemmatimonadales bacterium]
MTTPTVPGFAEWVAAADDTWTGDPLWSMQAYRLGMYAIVCYNRDRESFPALAKAPAFDQATRAIGSVAANIAEGYSRSGLADRNRFYGYALGSAREAIAWYDTLRPEIGDTATERQATLIQVRRLLLTILRLGRAASPLSSLSDPSRKTRRKKD